MIFPAPQPILPSGLASSVMAQAGSGAGLGAGAGEGGSVDPAKSALPSDPKALSQGSFLAQLLATTTAGNGAKAPKLGPEDGANSAQPLSVRPAPFEQPAPKGVITPPLITARLWMPGAQEVAEELATGSGEGERPAPPASLSIALAAPVAPAGAEGEGRAEVGKPLPLTGELLPRTKPGDLREGEVLPRKFATGSAGGDRDLQTGEAENQPLGPTLQSEDTLPSVPPIASLLTAGKAPQVKMTAELLAVVSDDAALPAPIAPPPVEQTQSEKTPVEPSAATPIQLASIPATAAPEAARTVRSGGGAISYAEAEVALEETALPEQRAEIIGDLSPKPDRALAFAPDTKGPAPLPGPAPKQSQALPSSPSLASQDAAALADAPDRVSLAGLPQAEEEALVASPSPRSPSPASPALPIASPPSAAPEPSAPVTVPANGLAIGPVTAPATGPARTSLADLLPIVGDKLPGSPSPAAPIPPAPTATSSAPETVQSVRPNGMPVKRAERGAETSASARAVTTERHRVSPELALAADAADRAAFAGLALREVDPPRGSPIPAVSAPASVSLPSAATSTTTIAPTESAPAAPAPAAAPAVPSSATATAQTPVNLSPNAPALSSEILEQVANQVADAREASRSLRPELTVRHSEFGTVAMRIEPGATSGAVAPAAASATLSDWRATLSARDPGFVPAVQAALADRSVQAASESGPLQSGLSQQGQSPQGQSPQGQSQSGASQRAQDSGTGTNASNAQTNAGFGSASGGGSEPRYGSSPGGSQGPAQPYSGEEGDGGSRRTAANSGAETDRDGSDWAGSEGAGDARGGALFA